MMVNLPKLILIVCKTKYLNSLLDIKDKDAMNVIITKCRIMLCVYLVFTRCKHGIRSMVSWIITAGFMPPTGPTTSINDL